MARRPSSLACWFTPRTALAVSSFTCLIERHLERRVPDEGTPPVSSTLAWDFTSAGTAGFCWIPVRNEVVSPVIRIEPARAVIGGPGKRFDGFVESWHSGAG